MNEFPFIFIFHIVAHNSASLRFGQYFTQKDSSCLHQEYLEVESKMKKFEEEMWHVALSLSSHVALSVWM